jgi:hypothetical protein
MTTNLDVLVLIESWGALLPLLPTEAYRILARAMAEELRKRGEYDASNYLVKAANAMEG